jgi:hypothetical protein
VLDILQYHKTALWLQVISDLIILALALFCAWLGFKAESLIGLLSVTMAVYNFVWLFVVLHMLQVLKSDLLLLAKEFVFSFVAWIAVQQAAAYLLPSSWLLPVSLSLAIVAFLPAAAKIKRLQRMGLN